VFSFDEKVVERPLGTHEEGVSGEVNMLVDVDDVAFVGVDELGDLGDEPLAVRAGESKNGSASVHVGDARIA